MTGLESVVVETGRGSGEEMRAASRREMAPGGDPKITIAADLETVIVAVLKNMPCNPEARTIEVVASPEIEEARMVVAGANLEAGVVPMRGVVANPVGGVVPRTEASASLEIKMARMNAVAANPETGVAPRTEAVADPGPGMTQMTGVAAGRDSEIRQARGTVVEEDLITAVEPTRWIAMVIVGLVEVMRMLVELNIAVAVPVDLTRSVGVIVHQDHAVARARTTRDAVVNRCLLSMMLVANRSSCQLFQTYFTLVSLS